MGKFNIVRFRQETASTRSSKSLKALARNAANTAFAIRKQEMLENFDEHVVTKEIQKGEKDPSSENLSGTLSGRGNLFSFIGFDLGSDPTADARHLLDEVVQMDKSPSIEDKGEKVLYKFEVTVDKEALFEGTPMPWEGGRSWVQGIEKGISGLGYYIYWKLDILDKYPNGSRSGSGIQSITNKLRSVVYKQTSYVSKIISDFLKKFK